MSLEETDAASAVVATAPRVTLADIKANTLKITFITGWDLTDPAGLSPKQWEELGTFTLCTLILRNGYVVIGKAAPAVSANYNSELGRKFAYEDAVRQVWPLMGYALRQRQLDLSKATDLPKETT